MKRREEKRETHEENKDHRNRNRPMMTDLMLTEKQRRDNNKWYSK
jgi:hypothetical protein